MEIVIKIPDDVYSKTINKNLNLSEVDTIGYAIMNGKPLPPNATNGDVIKAMFPNYRTDEMSHSVWVGYDDMSFRREWWNAPYKGE